MQDFPQRFIALRSALTAQTDPQFTVEQNAMVGDRPVALYARARIETERRFLGLFSTGGTAYSEEHRILLSVPALTAESLQDCIDYGKMLTDTLIVPKANHQYSFVSLMVVCPTADSSLLRPLKHLEHTCQLKDGRLGWAALRIAVLPLGGGKGASNPMGAPLLDLLKKAAK